MRLSLQNKILTYDTRIRHGCGVGVGIDSKLGNSPGWNGQKVCELFGLILGGHVNFLLIGQE